MSQSVCHLHIVKPFECSTQNKYHCKMRIVPKIFLLAALAVFAHAYNFNVNVGESLDGKIIHVESMRHRGHWFKSEYWYGRYVTADAVAERNTYYTQWSKILVKHIGGGVVVMESMRWRDHFFAAHVGWVAWIHSTYPDDKAWAKWMILCTSSDMTNCVFESMEFKGKYCFSLDWGKTVYGNYKESHSRYRILSPKPSDYYRSIWSTENNSGSEQKKSLTLYEGTTDTTSTSHTITVTVSLEVKAAFHASASLSGSISYEWKHVNTKTFEKQTTMRYDITIPPYTKIVLKQFTGVYGPFRVQAAKFKIDETNLQTGKQSDAVSKYFQV